MLLADIARARSGDKGAHANIAIIANNAQAYAIIEKYLTADRVRQYFFDRPITEVKRFAVPNLMAFNFMLYNALDGGASLSLRLDAQGKALGQQLLLMEITL